MAKFSSADDASGHFGHLVRYLVFRITRCRVNRFGFCLNILLGHYLTFFTIYITYIVFWDFSAKFTVAGIAIFDYISNEAWRLQACSEVWKAAMPWNVVRIVPTLCGECPVKVSMSWLLLLWQSFYYYNTITLRWGRFAPWGAHPPCPVETPRGNPPPRFGIFCAPHARDVWSLREKRSACFSVA